MQRQQHLRDAMARKGYSFRDLAFQTDLDPGYLCRVANGERRPSKDAALRIALALGSKGLARALRATGDGR